MKALVIFGTPVLKKPLNIQEGFCDIPALSTFFTETPTEEQIISASKIAVHQKKCAKLIENDFKKSNPKVRSAIVKNIENEAFLDEYTIFTNLEISTYIIAGKYDPTVRFAYLEMLQETAKKCKLICLEDCGHYTSLEQPIKFSIIVRQIIKEVY